MPIADFFKKGRRVYALMRWAHTLNYYYCNHIHFKYIIMYMYKYMYIFIFIFKYKYKFIYKYIYIVQTPAKNNI